MKKNEIIQELRKTNPLRSVSSWNKESKEELQLLYNEYRSVVGGSQ